MVGALNKLPIAIAGMMFFSDPVTFGGVTGVVIGMLTCIIRTLCKVRMLILSTAFSAGLLYSHAKNTAPKPPPSTPLPLHNTKSGEDQEGLLERSAKDEK